MPVEEQTSEDGAADGPEKIRTRIAKACDLCHASRAKCDGGSPCGRCRRTLTLSPAFAGH